MTQKKKVLFLSESCVLDPNSGAAIEMMGWLNILTARGYDCSSVTMSLFDGTTEFPMGKDIFPNLDLSQNVGKRLRCFINKVEHNVFYTGTSIGPKVTVSMVDKFIMAAAEDIRRISPDVVVCYGGRNLIPLLKLARSKGARTVFYLCNASYQQDRREVFDYIDQVVTPSDALGDLYRDRLGLEGIQTVPIRVQRFFPAKSLTQKFLLERQRNGFVTMINPDLSKGGSIFLQVANLLQTRRRPTTFLAVESRATQEEVEAMINGASQIRNIWWVQRQTNIRAVLARTAVLMVPSIYFEAAGRVIAEAMLAGIPVLATRNGGIPEQLNGGGTLFDIPAGFSGKNAQYIPTLDEVAPWADRIDELMMKDAAYVAACKRALTAADKFAAESVDQMIVAVIEGADVQAEIAEPVA